jgi:hypothetical protein
VISLRQLPLGPPKPSAAGIDLRSSCLRDEESGGMDIVRARLSNQLLGSRKESTSGEVVGRLAGRGAGAGLRGRQVGPGDSVLVMDGSVIGTWKRVIGKAQVDILARPFRKLAKPEKEAVEQAASRYAASLRLPMSLRLA